MKKETILTMLIILICLGSGFIGGAFYRSKGCESCQMYSTQLGINGVYFPSEEYYCVWIEGKTENQIQNTECHELCHHFVKKDKEHFCK